eukprot:TRINITY_DN23593_c0_g4_i2.p1 TRINITY_DN23593_c0_g4~~TRINITY_DN23593_c0_g4_i2.p1  ORF type:complete len:372 (-),score=40.40 TRINITY_DN23593_c0_g4_i2:164-1279(-)
MDSASCPPILQAHFAYAISEKPQEAAAELKRLSDLTRDPNTEVEEESHFADLVSCKPEAALAEFNRLHRFLAEGQRRTEAEEEKRVFKILLVGDAACGKTHLLSRQLHDRLPKAPTATIGVEFATREFQVDGVSVKAQMWDTAGQERYRAITRAHYRRTQGALLVYDITKRASFENCLSWLRELQQNAEPNIVVMLVGCKLDLVESEPSSREVKFETAARFARQYRCSFAEVSAASGRNVKYVFDQLFKEVLEQSTDLLVSCTQVDEPEPAVVCTTVAGREFGRYTVPRSWFFQASLVDWLPPKVFAQMTSRCRLQLVNTAGAIFWTQPPEMRSVVSTILHTDGTIEVGGPSALQDTEQDLPPASCSCCVA